MNKYKFKIKNRKIRVYKPGNLLRADVLLHQAKASFTLKGKSTGNIYISHNDYEIRKLKGKLSTDAKQLLVLIIRNEIMEPVSIKELIV